MKKKVIADVAGRSPKRSRAGAPRSHPTQRARGKWVKAARGRRVLVDKDGRILRGERSVFTGAHVDDLGALERALRELEREERSCDTARRRQRARTFRLTEQGADALVAANPELLDWLEGECSHDCEAYRAWVRGGRRGSKRPSWFPGDGRFDLLSETHERRGKRRITSWLEGVFATVPPSHRWQDFPARVAVLAEATGLRLSLPQQAENLFIQEAERAECHRGAETSRDDLLERARHGRLVTEEDLNPEAGDIPF